MASAMLDIQSLPSLERFDSQLLDLFRQGGNEAGGAGVHVMDELHAPDDDLALQRLMSLKNSQNKAAAAAALQLQQQLDMSGAQHSPTHSPETPHVPPNMISLHQQQMQQQQTNVPVSAAAGAVSTAEAAQLAAQHLVMQTAGDGYNLPSAQELMAAQGGRFAASSLGLSGLDANMLSMAGDNPFALAANGYGMPDDTEALLADAAAGFMPGMMGSNSVVGNKRRSRGSQMADLIRMEQDCMVDCEGFMDGEYQPEDSRTSTQSPGKRSKGAKGESHGMNMMDSDDEDQRLAGLSITPDMDEQTRARIRREKNRVAARKCRAKKMQFMVELQKTLRELMRKNEEYRLQVITWHKMFSREVRLREAMKRIIAVMWQCGAPPAASGYTANDIIIGLESGTLDINSLVRSLAVLSAPPHFIPQDQHGCPPPAAAGPPHLANLQPLSLNQSNAAVAGAGGAMPPVTPRVPPTALLHQLSDVSTHADEVAMLNGANRSAGMNVLPNGGAAAGPANGCNSPLNGEYQSGMMSMSMLMADNSHLSSQSAMAGGAQNVQSNAVKMTAGDAGVNGLPDMMSAGGQAAGAGGLEGTWMWGNTQGLHTASAAVVGPSCITTGVQE